MSTPNDPAELKRTQREQWSLSARGWKQWWPTFEAGAQVVNDTLADMARLEPGMRVLDVACGLGEPTFTAARRVGARGLVVGVDLAARMIDFAAGEARDRQIRHVHFIEGDGESLPFLATSFDAAVSRWGLMLMPTPLHAARSIRRALKPGARFAAAVWSTADEVPFIQLPQSIAEREVGLAPVNPDAPGPLRMGREGTLEDCLASAGFRLAASRVVPLAMTFESASEFVRFQREMSGTLKRALESESREVQDRAWRTLERETERFVGPGGRVRFENRCRLAVALA